MKAKMKCLFEFEMSYIFCFKLDLFGIEQKHMGVFDVKKISRGATLVCIKSHVEGWGDGYYYYPSMKTQVQVSRTPVKAGHCMRICNPIVPTGSWE